jgi:hypothetical protein
LRNRARSGDGALIVAIACYAPVSWGSDIAFSWPRLGKAVVELLVVIGFPM